MINGKIVDTSVWIDYFNKKTDKRIILLDNLLDNREIVMVPVIMQEVLQGINEDSVFKLVRETFFSFNQIEYNNIEAALNAALLYRYLRKKGTTIRKPNDCLIAWFCINFNLELLHNDKDFDYIAKHTSLKIYK
jgi:predicted nucleic acid-binding protein